MYKLIFASLLTICTHAILTLDIEMIHEKGLGGSMILKSELFTKELVYQNKDVVVKMKNGIELRLQSNFNEESDEFGPSSVFTIKGEVLNISKESEQKKFDVSTTLNNAAEINFKTDSGQSLYINITPVLR